MMFPDPPERDMENDPLYRLYMECIQACVRTGKPLAIADDYDCLINSLHDGRVFVDRDEGGHIIAFTCLTHPLGIKPGAVCRC